MIRLLLLALALAACQPCRIALAKLNGQVLVIECPCDATQTGVYMDDGRCLCRKPDGEWELKEVACGH